MGRLTFKITTFLVLSVLVSNVFAVTTYNQRITKIVYDFDGNGVTDATDVYQYQPSGKPANTSYVYTGDGLVDKLNTRDANFSLETNVFGYNSSGLMNSLVVDRGSQLIESDASFLNGGLNRVDLIIKDGIGTVLIHHHWLFNYNNNVLNQVENFDTLTGSSVNTEDFVFNSNGLPLTMVQSSPPPGITFSNTFTWRTDSQIDAISTVTSGGLGTGDVDLFYDPQNRLSSELWSFTGFVGSPYARLQLKNYRKSYFYDVNNLKVREEFDLNVNGSVDAILTYEWEEAICLPTFYWAPNGMPNFITTPDYPYVAGTGAFQIEACGGTPNTPTNIPLPLWSMVLLGASLLGVTFYWKKRPA